MRKLKKHNDEDLLLVRRDQAINTRTQTANIQQHTRYWKIKGKESLADVFHISNDFSMAS